jgi:acetyl esterase/lipase
LDDAEEGPVVLFLHGGGYTSCSPRNVRDVLARLLLSMGRGRILSLDYRLAPQHPFPAAVDDAISALHWLLASGRHASQLVIAGESAGGGLAAAVLLALRDAKQPLPAAGVLVSPWLDLSARSGPGGSLETNASYDWVDATDLARRARLYLGDQDPTAPLASPGLATLSGLPPLLVQVGDAEMLRDQAVAFVEKALHAGTPVELDVIPDMIHGIHSFAGISRTARAGLDRVGSFVRKHGVSPASDTPEHSR